MMIRVGVGYDIHSFAVGRRLVLGGVTIPYDRGLDGHSDADALLHAVCDALLGAAGLGDIGEHFPTSDKTLKGISSLVLLEKTRDLVGARGYEIGNVDVTVLAEAPMLKDHKPKMRSNIARALKISDDAVNIKATTNEGLGAIGAGKGIAAYAVVAIAKAK